MLEKVVELTTMFDVGKITRPRLSLDMMIEHGHEVKFWKQASSIKLKGAEEKINPCKEVDYSCCTNGSECLLAC